MAGEWTTMVAVLEAVRAEPARAGSVAVGWLAVWWTVGRLGWRYSEWLRGVEEGRHGWMG